MSRPILVFGYVTTWIREQKSFLTERCNCNAVEIKHLKPLIRPGAAASGDSCETVYVQLLRNFPSNFRQSATLLPSLRLCLQSDMSAESINSGKTVLRCRMQNFSSSKRGYFCICESCELCAKSLESGRTLSVENELMLQVSFLRQWLWRFSPACLCCHKLSPLLYSPYWQGMFKRTWEDSAVCFLGIRSWECSAWSSSKENPFSFTGGSSRWHIGFSFLFAEKTNLMHMTSRRVNERFVWKYTSQLGL